MSRSAAALRISGPIAAALIALCCYGVLRLVPGLDTSLEEPRGHFYIVSTVSIFATILAIAMGIAGHRLRNVKVTFLSLAFISMAALFAMHGLATPGFLLPPNRIPDMAAQLSVFLTAAWLFLSSVSADHPLMKLLSGARLRLLIGWTVLVIGFAVFGLLHPAMFNDTPLASSPLTYVFTIVTVILTFVTAYRYAQSYRYSELPLQLAIIYCSLWIAVAQFIMVTGVMWMMSWWIYHILLLFSAILMIWGLVSQYASGRSLNLVFRALFTSNPAERIEAGISPKVRALIVKTELRDSYTAGHNFRVAMYALKLAEAMRLSPELQRAIAQGGVVHDVGKIEIPDDILNKPGALTAEERAEIEKHPVIGYAMCRELGFMPEELEIIRWHHERYDGTGYPDRLSRQEIPLHARILAVADVYDALTSDRAYRQAWSHDQAMMYLREESGKSFDPHVVEVWDRLTSDNTQLITRFPEWAASGRVRALQSDLQGTF